MSVQPLSVAEIGSSGGRRCRVCHKSSSDSQPLIVPCGCKGTISYAHETCVKEWILRNGSVSCSVCGRQYVMTRVFAPHAPRRGSHVPQWLQSLVGASEPPHHDKDQEDSDDDDDATHEKDRDEKSFKVASPVPSWADIVFDALLPLFGQWCRVMASWMLRICFFVVVWVVSIPLMGGVSGQLIFNLNDVLRTPVELLLSYDGLMTTWYLPGLVVTLVGLVAVLLSACVFGMMRENEAVFRPMIAEPPVILGDHAHVDDEEDENAAAQIADVDDRDESDHEEEKEEAADKEGDGSDSDEEVTKPTTREAASAELDGPHAQTESQIEKSAQKREEPTAPSIAGRVSQNTLARTGRVEGVRGRQNEQEKKSQPSAVIQPLNTSEAERALALLRAREAVRRGDEHVMLSSFGLSGSYAVAAVYALCFLSLLPLVMIATVKLPLACGRAASNALLAAIDHLVTSDAAAPWLPYWFGASVATVLPFAYSQPLTELLPQMAASINVVYSRGAVESGRAGAVVRGGVSSGWFDVVSAWMFGVWCLTGGLAMAHRWLGASWSRGSQLTAMYVTTVAKGVLTAWMQLGLLPAVCTIALVLITAPYVTTPNVSALNAPPWSSSRNVSKVTLSDTIPVDDLAHSVLFEGDSQGGVLWQSSVEGAAMELTLRRKVVPLNSSHPPVTYTCDTVRKSRHRSLHTHTAVLSTEHSDSREVVLSNVWRDDSGSGSLSATEALPLTWGYTLCDARLPSCVCDTHADVHVVVPDGVIHVSRRVDVDVDTSQPMTMSRDGLLLAAWRNTSLHVYRRRDAVLRTFAGVARLVVEPLTIRIDALLPSDIMGLNIETVVLDGNGTWLVAVVSVRPVDGVDDISSVALGWRISSDESITASNYVLCRMPTLPSEVRVVAASIGEGDGEEEELVRLVVVVWSAELHHVAYSWALDEGVTKGFHESEHEKQLPGGAEASPPRKESPLLGYVTLRDVPSNQSMLMVYMSGDYAAFAFPSAHGFTVHLADMATLSGLVTVRADDEESVTLLASTMSRSGDVVAVATNAGTVLFQSAITRSTRHRRSSSDSVTRQLPSSMEHATPTIRIPVSATDLNATWNELRESDFMVLDVLVACGRLLDGGLLTNPMMSLDTPQDHVNHGVPPHVFVVDHQEHVLMPHQEWLRDALSDVLNNKRPTRVSRWIYVASAICLRFGEPAMEVVVWVGLALFGIIVQFYQLQCWRHIRRLTHQRVFGRLLRDPIELLQLPVLAQTSHVGIVMNGIQNMVLLVIPYFAVCRCALWLLRLLLPGAVPASLLWTSGNPVADMMCWNFLFLGGRFGRMMLLLGWGAAMPNDVRQQQNLLEAALPGGLPWESLMDMLERFHDAFFDHVVADLGLGTFRLTGDAPRAAEDFTFPLRCAAAVVLYTICGIVGVALSAVPGYFAMPLLRRLVLTSAEVFGEGDEVAADATTMASYGVSFHSTVLGWSLTLLVVQLVHLVIRPLMAKAKVWIAEVRNGSLSAWWVAKVVESYSAGLLSVEHRPVTVTVSGRARENGAAATATLVTHIIRIRVRSYPTIRSAIGGATGPAEWLVHRDDMIQRLGQAKEGLLSHSNDSPALHILDTALLKLHRREDSDGMPLVALGRQIDMRELIAIRDGLRTACSRFGNHRIAKCECLLREGASVATYCALYASAVLLGPVIVSTCLIQCADFLVSRLEGVQGAVVATAGQRWLWGGDPMDEWLSLQIFYRIVSLVPWWFAGRITLAVAHKLWTWQCPFVLKFIEEYWRFGLVATFTSSYSTRQVATVVGGCTLWLFAPYTFLPVVLDRLWLLIDQGEAPSMLLGVMPFLLVAAVWCVTQTAVDDPRKLICTPPLQLWLPVTPVTLPPHDTLPSDGFGVSQSSVEPDPPARHPARGIGDRELQGDEVARRHHSSDMLPNMMVFQPPDGAATDGATAVPAAATDGAAAVPAAATDSARASAAAARASATAARASAAAARASAAAARAAAARATAAAAAAVVVDANAAAPAAAADGSAPVPDAAATIAADSGAPTDATAVTFVATDPTRTAPQILVPEVVRREAEDPQPMLEEVRDEETVRQVLFETHRQRTLPPKPSWLKSKVIAFVCRFAERDYDRAYLVDVKIHNTDQ